MAAVNAIIRLIMSKGVPEAIKKHGSAAVKEARRHMDDLMTKPTKGQQAVDKATKSQRAARSKARKAVVGTTAVLGGAYAANQTSKNNSKRKNKVGARTANMLKTQQRGRVVSETKLGRKK